MNNKILNYIFGISIFITLFACKDDFEFEQSNEKLVFSEDTLFLDTVFNSIRTETFFLKIYNKENRNIKINRIYLENLQNSFYKINVDGKAGSDFSDVLLRAKDSLYIYVELAVKNQANESIIQEKLFFENGTSKQNITLFALAEDVELFKPNQGQDFLEINQNTTWNSKKPKLIFKELRITNKAKLTIQEGTKVYFSRNSKLSIDSESELEINGTLKNEVLFRGDRHSSRYDTLYGNWDQIRLLTKAKANINYARIQGGTYGLFLENGANLTLKNTKIFNQQKDGIIAVNSTINAENIVLNNCGNSCLQIFGGTYSFIHSTFANYSRYVFSPYSVILNETFLEPLTGRNQIYSLKSNFENSILVSSMRNSIRVESTINSNKYLFNNCLIDIVQTENPSFINSIFNLNPSFENVNLSKNDLRLKENSPARAEGSLEIANKVPMDIQGKSRTVLPNLGAYQ